MIVDSFSVIGPVMIGPSSSHTAGAARIGRIAGMLLGRQVRSALITLSGSFARTYRGHGTDRALAAGILGMEPDDGRLRDSLQIARERGVDIEFVCRDIPDAHPNTAALELTGDDGSRISLQGASVGGGSVLITSLNGYPVHIDGESCALVVVHTDVPGIVAAVSNALSDAGVNICTLSLARDDRGGTAVMTIGTDGDVPGEVADAVARIPQVHRCMLVPGRTANRKEADAR